MNYNNCYMALLYLILRGKVKEVIAISLLSRGAIGKYFFHLIGVNKKGHVLHFDHALDDKYNDYAPFWFLGKIRGISKKKQEKVLKASGRKILWRTKQVWWVIPYIILMWFVTSIILYLMIYPLFLFISIKGFIEALVKRK